MSHSKYHLFLTIIAKFIEQLKQDEICKTRITVKIATFLIDSCKMNRKQLIKVFGRFASSSGYTFTYKNNYQLDRLSININ